MIKYLEAETASEMEYGAEDAAKDGMGGESEKGGDGDGEA